MVVLVLQFDCVLLEECHEVHKLVTSRSMVEEQKQWEITNYKFKIKIRIIESIEKRSEFGAGKQSSRQSHSWLLVGESRPKFKLAVVE